ncbi:hypothetical protein EGI11_10730 [Chryseobacterium sp. H3056]|jgi:hypothetical protein|uniref:Uncharacterized protein n=1 Tax=Kaistella daneshvariae TaxID=2487074 RepID=A0A3N0WVG0_9FLAO|nr:hypothetical protein EGI11_10730 [Kaistella daneshvariae]
MNLKAVIRESVNLKVDGQPQSVIVEFVGDKKKQHFEILFYDLDPYNEGIRKWDTWELSIKWKSDIFVDPKTGKKSYFTYLLCDKAVPVHQMGK